MDAFVGRIELISIYQQCCQRHPWFSVEQSVHETVNIHKGLHSWVNILMGRVFGPRNWRMGNIQVYYNKLT